MIDRRLLSIGGPVGVELAGEIEDVFRALNDADAKNHATTGGNGHDEKKQSETPRSITILQRSSRLNVNFPVCTRSRRMRL
jgi:hypothetical protein